MPSPSPVKLIISGDAESAKQAVLQQVAAMEQLQKSAETLSQGTDKATDASKRHEEALRKEILAMGLGAAAQKQALDALEKQLASESDSAKSKETLTRSQQQYIENLKREAIEIAGGKEALRAYEVAQLGFSDKTLKQVEALQQSINAHKAAEDSVRRGGEAQEGVAKKIDNLTNSMFKGVGAVEILSRAWDKAVETYHAVVAATEAAQQSQTRMESVLRATGGASGQTSETVERLVQNMSHLTQFDDRGLRDAATTLLTFREVGGQAFERVLKLSADLAATGRGDLQTWVTMLAKAGTDPAETIGLVERSFGKLDARLKVAIQNAADMNNKARAQVLLFDELERRVGGTAADAYVGLTRKIEGTKKAWDDLYIAAGNKIFDAGSKDASKMEQNLRRLKEFIEEDNWFQKVMVALAGGNPYAVGGSATEKTDPVQVFRNQLDALKRLETAAGASDSPRRYLLERGYDPATLKTQIALLESRLRGLEQSAAAAAQRGAMGPNDGPQPPATARQLMTDRNLQDLRMQDLQQQRAYLDQVYQDRQAAVDRELALDEARHNAGVMSEAAYFARLAQLGEQRERDEVARIQSEIALEKERVAAAEGELGRATKAQKPDEVVAAEKTLSTERAALLKLTLDLGVAESHVGDAARKTAVSQYQSDADMMERVTRIARARQDDERTLSRQAGDLRLQLDLVGKTEEQAALLTNQRKLQLQFQDEERKIIREIADLQADKKKDHSDEIADLEAQLKDLPGLYDAASKAQASIIGQTYLLRNQVKVYDELVDGVGRFISTLGSGGSVFNKLISLAKSFGLEMASIFGRRYALNFLASVTGNTGLAAQAATIGQGTVAGAASNFLGNAGSSALGGVFGGSLIGSGSLLGEFGTGLTQGLVPGMGLAGEIGASIYSAIMAVPVWGWIAGGIAALAYAFRDRGENWKGRLGFGDNAQAYASTGPFGREGFQYIQGDDKVNSAIQRFMESTHAMDRIIARNLGQPQIDRIISNLAGPYATRNDGQPAEFAFGKGDDTAFNQFTLEYIQHKYGIVFDEINTQFAEHIRKFQGSAQDLLKEIQQFVGAFDAVKQSIADVQDMITSLSEDPVERVKGAMASLDRQVSRAQDALDAAFESNDPQQILQAEQNLTRAVMNRYQSELQMVQQLQQAIDDMKEQAYQFSLGLAQRIVAAGGTRDIAGMAWNRAMDLRGTIGGDYDPGGQFRRLQQYTGAIDTWYQARRDAIMHDAQQQAAQFAAAQQAQAAAYQARIAAVQTEVQLTQQWAGILQQVEKQIEQMKLSASNPAPTLARLQLAQGDASSARAAWLASTGQGRVTAASRYLEALTAQQSLLEQGYQRPSIEYEQGYNAVMRGLAEVRGEAKSQADRAIELQEQLVRLQGEANSIGSASFDMEAATRSAMEGLNQQYIAQLTFAEGHGARLEGLIIQQTQDQINAITGGHDVQAWQLAAQRDSRDYLRRITTAVERWTNNGGPPSGSSGSSGSSTPPPSAGNTVSGITRGTFRQLVREEGPFIRREISVS